MQPAQYSSADATPTIKRVPSPLSETEVEHLLTAPLSKETRTVPPTLDHTATSLEEERHRVHLSLPPLPVLLLLHHSATVDNKVVTLALIHYGSLQFNHYPWAPYQDKLSLVKIAWNRAKMVFPSSSVRLDPYTSLIMEQTFHITERIRTAAREVAIHFYTGIGPASVVARRADVALADDVNFIYHTVMSDAKKRYRAFENDAIIEVFWRGFLHSQPRDTCFFKVYFEPLVSAEAILSICTTLHWAILEHATGSFFHLPFGGLYLQRIYKRLKEQWDQLTSIEKRRVQWTFTAKARTALQHGIVPYFDLGLPSDCYLLSL